MEQTSIHIRPCLVGSSEAHNYRKKDLPYVRKDLTSQNEHWESDAGKNLTRLLSDIKETYGRHHLTPTGKPKKMHKKSVPLREGVVVIAPHTTMQHLRNFTKACKQEWGIEAVQIHIHRDEGHEMTASKKKREPKKYEGYEVGEWKPNLHAHIVFNWTDEKGESFKLGREDMVKMQTILAEHLHMERGVSSDKKHLNAIQFKMSEEEKEKKERLSNLQEEITQRTQDLKDLNDDYDTTKESLIQSLKACGEKYKTTLLNEISNTVVNKTSVEIAPPQISKYEKEDVSYLLSFSSSFKTLFQKHWKAFVALTPWGVTQDNNWQERDRVIDDLVRTNECTLPNGWWVTENDRLDRECRLKREENGFLIGWFKEKWRSAREVIKELVQGYKNTHNERLKKDCENKARKEAETIISEKTEVINKKPINKQKKRLRL